MQGGESSAHGRWAQRRVVVVEDETLISLYLANILAELEVELCGIATNGRTALELVACHRPCLALVDLNLPGELDGIATARLLSAEHGTRVIFLSGDADKAGAEEVLGVRPVAFLAKPFLEEDLKAALHRAFEQE